MDNRASSPLLKAASVIVVLMIVAVPVAGFMSYKQVPEGHIGVEKKWGDVTGNEYNPGPHWTVPIQDGVQDVEIRPRTYNSTVGVTTLNGTTFDVSYVIRYRVVQNESAEFVEQWNTITQAEDRLIDPTVEDRMRKEAAGIKSSILYTEQGRDLLSSAAREQLDSEFSDEAMVLEAVQITNIGIPGDYQNALNEKEIAKQQVQKERYNVQVEEQRARQVEIQAEADANVIRIKGQALRDNPIVLRDRYIDAINETDKVIISGDAMQGGNQSVILDASN